MAEILAFSGQIVSLPMAEIETVLTVSLPRSGPQKSWDFCLTRPGYVPPTRGLGSYWPLGAPDRPLIAGLDVKSIT